MPKLHLITYGCQMNEYDSERVAGLLTHARYELTESPEAADLILLNTCSIRERAEEKVFSQLGSLRRLKSANPDLLIGVMGCMAQLQQGGEVDTGCPTTRDRVACWRTRLGFRHGRVDVGATVHGAGTRSRISSTKRSVVKPLASAS